MLVAFALGAEVTPVPASPTLRPEMPEEGGGLSGMLSSALFAPSVVGLNATVIVQSAPPLCPSCTGGLVEQVPPVIENSDAFAPLMLNDPSVATVPTGPVTAATKVVSEALLLPMTVLGKLSVKVAVPRPGAVWWPTPAVVAAVDVAPTPMHWVLPPHSARLATEKDSPDTNIPSSRQARLSAADAAHLLSGAIVVRRLAPYVTLDHGIIPIYRKFERPEARISF